MVAHLKQEQGDDDDKKEYCANEFDLLDDLANPLHNIEMLRQSLADDTNAKEANALHNFEMLRRSFLTRYCSWPPVHSKAE